ncbi:complex I subunit 4 family protein [Candidatus Methylacidithermus pantelleriae]|uniref:NADH quinone-oxidoreductase subunit M n=1 Tax=Candidatus Methylacidithermus pantelleriae TaxID=2744239 RepID=A0A8J2BR33_9BACT|nr:NADH-quinone oxidoreductase subunit M [Candidatus Methylacidithermus pantelleriae]CAF0700769.1 NADH quinone-oxidoreductase subunit M [Candidatus Methylacidithermus pantelleriae]
MDLSPLTILLLIPVLGIAVIAFSPWNPKAVAVFAAGSNLVWSLLLYAGFDPDFQGFQFVQDSPWITFAGLPAIRYHVGLDGINLPLVLLTAIVTMAAVAIAPSRIERGREFFSYLLLVSLGALGAFVSLDLFFFYVFHEIALVPTFLLIGIWGRQNRQLASLQLTLYLAAGSLVLLAGILGLLFLFPGPVRTFDIPELERLFRQHAPGLEAQRWVYLLLLVGFGTLVSLVPFHSWAPLGYATAPPAAAMLHAGVLKKFGLYGLLRVALPLLPEGVQAWKPLWLILLLGNIIYVGLVTLAQRELGLMLGFSSVMHMGYVFLGLASWNELGVSGAVLLMVAHGLSSALLFALAGEIGSRTGVLSFSELGGLAAQAPFLTVAFLFGSFASIGLPGLANFAGEVLIFFGSWKAFPWVTTLALWGVVLSAIYQLRAVRQIFFGPLPERLQRVGDLGLWRQRAPYMLLLVSLVIVGVVPGSLLRVIEPAVRGLLALSL